MPIIVRVYGIVLDSNNRLLLTDEFCYGQYMTKFVGGGLEFGEGLADCLKREFLEETGQEIIVGELLYINDKFQGSAFQADAQLLSVYYWVEFKTPFPESKLIPERPWKDGAQYFRWVETIKIHPDDLTWPVDKEVLILLQSKIRD